MTESSSEPTPTDPPGALDPEMLGARLQGILLGFPLFLAILKMLALAEGASLFRYQGF